MNHARSAKGTAATGSCDGTSPPPSPDRCLDANELSTWLEGWPHRRLPTYAESHIDVCARCRSLVASLVDLETEAIPDTEPGRDVREQATEDRVGSGTTRSVPAVTDRRRASWPALPEPW